MRKHEKLYSNVSNSLKKYQGEIFAFSDSIDPMMNDFMKMDYNSFKKKHKLSDEEMNVLANTFTVTYQIGSSFRAINQNMNNLSKNVYMNDSINTEKTIQKEKYSFSN